jgi:hypothetical protein
MPESVGIRLPAMPDVMHLGAMRTTPPNSDSKRFNGESQAARAGTARQRDTESSVRDYVGPADSHVAAGPRCRSCF